MRSVLGSIRYAKKAGASKQMPRILSKTLTQQQGEVPSLKLAAAAEQRRDDCSNAVWAVAAYAFGLGSVGYGLNDKIKSK